MRDFIEFSTLKASDIFLTFKGFAIDVMVMEDWYPTKLVDAGMLPKEYLERDRYKYLSVSILLWSLILIIDIRLEMLPNERRNQENRDETFH